MRRVAIVSSSILSIGYAECSGVLEVEFCNGGVYRYFDVPPEEHASLMVAQSKGEHLNQAIRTQFSFVRVDGR
jgi:hypothetical protein